MSPRHQFQDVLAGPLLHPGPPNLAQQLGLTSTIERFRRDLRVKKRAAVREQRKADIQQVA
jgi:hypothetical protein